MGSLHVLLNVRNLAHGVIPRPAGLVRFIGEWA